MTTSAALPTSKLVGPCDSCEITSDALDAVYYVSGVLKIWFCGVKVRTSELDVSGQFTLTVGAYASTGFCATVKLRKQDGLVESELDRDDKSRITVVKED